MLRASGSRLVPTRCADDFLREIMNRKVLSRDSTQEESLGFQPEGAESITSTSVPKERRWFHPCEQRVPCIDQRPADSPNLQRVRKRNAVGVILPSSQRGQFPVIYRREGHSPGDAFEIASQRGITNRICPCSSRYLQNCSSVSKPSFLNPARVGFGYRLARPVRRSVVEFPRLPAEKREGAQDANRYLITNFKEIPSP
jgi:hypothetical protein